MKNFKYIFLVKIFMLACFMVFIISASAVSGPVEIFADSESMVVQTEKGNTATIEVTKTGLLRGDHAKLSLYYMSDLTKVYVSPSPQEVGDGQTVSWMGLIPGTTYFVEEDFHKITNIYVYDVANPVAEITIDSPIIIERTVQNNPNLITDTTAAAGTTKDEDADKPQDTIREDSVITVEQVSGETYILVHGSTILKSAVINMGENTATSDFTWYLLLTIIDKAIPFESAYTLDPLIYGPATFNPISTMVSFSFREINPGSNSNGDNVTLSGTEIAQLPWSFRIGTVMLVSTLCAFIGFLVILIAPARRRTYRKWKHVISN